MIKRLFKGIFDFIIPPLCVSCEDPVKGEGRFICSACREKLVRFDAPHPWRNAYIDNGFMDESLSVYRFIKDSPIQHLLHSMKYEKMKSIGTMLGAEIAQHLPAGMKFDYAVPVPLHISKFRERTYNQSEYISKGIASAPGIKILPGILKRTRYTKSQTKLDKTMRADNVRGAFVINPKLKHLISGKNIILADDVITTGATILECARVLKENQAAYVIVCSAAYDALD